MDQKKLLEDKKRSLEDSFRRRVRLEKLIFLIVAIFLSILSYGLYTTGSEFWSGFVLCQAVHAIIHILTPKDLML
mgnify:CR=1 FL=1